MRSGSEVDQVHLEAAVGYTDKSDGALTSLRKAIAVHHWDRNLKLGDNILFDFPEYFTPQTRATARHDLPDSMDLLEDIVFLTVSARRVVDGKEVAFSEPYGIIADDAGKAKVSKVGRREFLDSLDRPILRPVKRRS